MGKTANPADAYRKQQRAKELKKNKEARKSARDNQLVKKDTRDLEAEIKSIKAQGKLKDADKSRLAELEKELSYVKKVKEKYVSEHPEARDRVFKPWAQKQPLPGHEDEDGNGAGSSKGDPLAHLYDEDGRLRDPKRSVYYDEVYNPYGVPPPGMPYLEKPMEGGEEEEDDDDDVDDEDGDSDDEIIMPEGPPPDSDGDDSDDSDDIPLPEGPPPPKSLPMPPLPPLPAGPSFAGPPMHFQPPPFDVHWPMQPPPLAAAPMAMPMSIPLHAQQQQSFGRPPAGQMQMRPPRPPRHHPATAVQDPLSDQPTQTYQGYRQNRHDLPARPPSDGSSSAISAAPTTNTTSNPNLPPKPTNASGGADAASAAGAGMISAAPQLRDLRKEATAFVPRGVKRKKAAGTMINAAPGAGEIDEAGDEIRKREGGGPGLLGKLSGVLCDLNSAPGGSVDGATSTGGSGDDEYQRFLEGLGDLK